MSIHSTKTDIDTDKTRRNTKMKRNIEIDDTLEEDVQGAIDAVQDELERYLKENPDTDEVPDLNNDLDYSGAIHEIVDGSVPVYTHNIESLWYLHADKFEEAYENAGIGNNPRENAGMAAIYCYIMDRVNEWYSKNAQDVFEAWQDTQDKAKK